MADFTAIFKPSKTRQPFEYEAARNPLFLIKDAFRLETLLALGAAIQALLLAILPLRLALAPAVLYLLFRVTNISLQVQKVIPSEYNSDVVPGKVSAQLPSRKTGRFGNVPAAQPVVVFLLGVRFNHPLGLLSPGAQEINEHFFAMNNDLMANSDKHGMLGVSTWSGVDRKDTNSLLQLYYFRDMQSLNAFAHSAVHRAGWDWFNKAKLPHIGILHEVFEVPAGAYESIYVNFQPTMMGGVVSKVGNEEAGSEEWVRALVAANKGPLRSQFGRMAKSAGNEHDSYGEEPVWEGQKA